MQGFAPDHTKPCSPLREKTQTLHVKSNTSGLFRPNSISQVVGDAYGETGLSNVFGVANYEEHRLRNFPDDLADAQIVLTGTFQTVPRRLFEQKLEDLGATVAAAVSSKTDYLIVGGTASRDWIEVNRGTKIRKALEFRLAGKGPLFISEWQLLRLMGQ